mmetsp:Transcript_18198/g.25044  ORF Transcript_18198/g.25044 Transcript_18198/m.25044 type:complete len:415 (-) Transcript_18198:44-1288(-)
MTKKSTITFNTAATTVLLGLFATSNAFNGVGNSVTSHHKLHRPNAFHGQRCAHVLPGICHNHVSSQSKTRMQSSIPNVEESSAATNDVKDSQMSYPLSEISQQQQQLRKEQFTPFQKAARAAPIVTAISYILNPQPLDSAVANVWSLIYNFPAQNPIFEADVAVFGFFLWITLFSSLHLFLGPEQTKQSRLDGKMPVDPLSWVRVENWYTWFNPIVSYIGSIWIYLHFHERAPIPEVAPTFGVLAVEVLFGIWLYDLCFFPIHYMMHRTNVGSVRRVHGYHHRASHTLNSLETVQHSYIDGFLQVFVNIMVQQISPFGGAKHTLSRLLHNIGVTYLLSEAHSGYNLPWMSHNVFPEILGGAPRHEAHHHNGRVYYQQYFKYLDDFFGFTEDDDGIKVMAMKEEKKSEVAQSSKA